MFEHLNIGALVLFSFIALVLYIVNRIHKKNSPGVYFMLILSIAIVFADAWIEFNNEIDNINSFKSQEVLKCFSGGGAYSSSEIYKVSSQDGWKLYKGKFVQDSLVLEPNKCEHW